MSMKQVLYGFLGCGGLAGMAYLWTQWSGGEGKIRDIIHSITQKLSKTKIDDLEAKQTGIEIKIRASEKITEASKRNIERIQRDAIEDIEEILKENDISKIHKVVDTEWQDL